MAQCIKLPEDNIHFLLRTVHFCTGLILSRSLQRSEYVRYAGWVPALHCGALQHQSFTQENAQRGNQSHSRSSFYTYVKESDSWIFRLNLNQFIKNTCMRFWRVKLVALNIFCGLFVACYLYVSGGMLTCFLYSNRLQGYLEKVPESWSK